MVSTILSEVNALALRRVEKFYHAASNTHIFYQQHIGSLGVTGTGNFAREAYTVYSENLIATLNKLSRKELVLAKEKLSQADKGIKRTREIQFAVPRIVKTSLKARAEKRHQPLSDFIRTIVLHEFQSGKSAGDIHSWYESILTSSELSLGQAMLSDKASISIRLDPNALNPVQDIASVVGAKDTKLIKSVVLAAYAGGANDCISTH